MEHALLRQKFTWKASGKLHDEGKKEVKLAEMSDSHLLHVIGWVLTYPEHYSTDITCTLLEEAKYRCKHYIFISE
jgi:hypothetical protein